MQKSLFTAIAFIGLLSCNEPNQNELLTTELNLNFVERFDEFNDSLPRYFANIKSITRYRDELIFSDNAARRIFVTDLRLNFKRDFLSTGDGPNEVNSIQGITVSKAGEIIIPDYTLRKVVITDLSGSIKQVISPVLHQIVDENFFEQNGEIIFIDRRNKCIAIVDRTTTEIHTIPLPKKFLEHCSSSQTPRMSIFPHDEGYLILAHTQCPLLALVDSNGDLISLNDFSSASIFQHSKRLQAEFNANGTGQSVVFFHGANIFEKHLLAIATYRDVENNVSFNHLLKIDISNSNLELVQVLQLEESNWYHNFVVLEDYRKMIFFDSSSKNKYLDVYEF